MYCISNSVPSTKLLGLNLRPPLSGKAGRYLWMLGEFNHWPRLSHLLICGSDYNWIFNPTPTPTLTENHKSIKDVENVKYYFKITQFADDTIIILDGIQNSLQAVLKL